MVHCTHGETVVKPRPPRLMSTKPQPDFGIAIFIILNPHKKYDSVFLYLPSVQSIFIAVTMLMSFRPKVFLTVVVCLLVAAATHLPHRALAGCSHLPSVSVSPPDGDVTSFDDADQVGGLHQIDKITQIDVYRVDALFRNVISKIVITYLRTDGELVILSHGKGGELAGQVTFEDGQYLSAIELFVEEFVQHIRLCRTDGICFGPFGYNQDAAPNRVLYKQRSVIKAILGQSGNVVDKIRAYYETDMMYKAEIGEIIYQNITVPTIISDLSFESPKAKVTVDNLGSSVDQSLTVSFEESVTTYETTIVTKTKQLFGSVSLTKDPGFLVQLGVADLAASFTVGTSFSLTLSEANTKEMKTAITREYTVVAPPFSVVTGQVYWRQIKYAYDWNAPVQCRFTFEPQTAFRGGTIEGNMYGTQAFPHSYVKFTQAFPATNTSPMMAPSTVPLLSPSTMPVDAPVEAPTSSPVFTPPTSIPVRPPRIPPTVAPMASPVGIPRTAMTMSPSNTSPVSPPGEVIVPVDGMPLPLPTVSPTLKGSTGLNPLSPLPNVPVSAPVNAVAPVNESPTVSPTDELIASPVGGPAMSQLPVSPPLVVNVPVDVSPSSPPTTIPFMNLSGSPMMPLSKAPTSSPTNFIDGNDDYDTGGNYPTSPPQVELTIAPTEKKGVSSARPTRKPRSSIYDDESNEETVTSDSSVYPFTTTGIKIWAVGGVLFLIM